MVEHIKFTVKIVPGPEIEQSDAERLTCQLRDELKEFEVLCVDSIQSDELPPKGSKALDPISTPGMLVTMGNETKQLKSMVTGIQDWVSSRDTCKVVLDFFDGNKIELDKATRYETQMLINAWINSINMPRLSS